MIVIIDNIYLARYKTFKRICNTAKSFLLFNVLTRAFQFLFVEEKIWKKQENYFIEIRERVLVSSMNVFFFIKYYDYYYSFDINEWIFFNKICHTKQPFSLLIESCAKLFSIKWITNCCVINDSVWHSEIWKFNKIIFPFHQNV